jgi:peptidyl-prolyl cis-trans isomerase C
MNQKLHADRHRRSAELDSAISMLLLLALLWVGSRLRAFAAEPAQTPPKPRFSVAATNLFADRILAKGKGVEVRQSQLDDLYVAFKANQAAAGKLVPDALRKKIEADILDKLITTQLVLSRATEADRTKAKGLVEELVAGQRQQAPSEESFNRQLLAVGMTPEQYRAQMLEQAIVESVIDREIRAKKVVTEAQAREFYDRSPELFQEPELARVSHILFSTQDPKTGQDLPADQKLEKRRLAEKILDRAKKGEDFAALGKDFSDDTPSKDRGGEYTIARARDDQSRSVVPEFEAAAFSLAPNQVSDLVTTRYGYHILKALERIPARTMEFSRVVERIKQGLLKQEVEKDLPAYVEKLKKSADVQIAGGD